MSNLNFSYKNKRILQIIPNMEIGGAEKTVIEIASFLKQREFSSLVLTSGGKLINNLYANNIEVIILPIDNKNPFLIFKNIFIFMKIFREKKINLVHVRSRAPAWSAIFAAKKTGVPVLTTWHGHVKNTSIFKKFYNSIMLKGDAVIANSSYTAKKISEIYKINLNKIDVISRGVNVKTYEKSQFSNKEIKKIKKLWNVSDDKKIILLPARLTKWKGHLVAIEAINLLKKENFFDQIYFIFAGEKKGAEKYLKKLVNAIEKNKIQKNVKIVERIENMPLAYQAADIILAPSIEPEPFGRIPIEAQAAGKIIMSSKLDGICEVLKHNKNSIIVKSHNYEAWSYSLKKILTNYYNIDEIQKNALKTAKHYTWKKRAFKIVKNYKIQKDI